MKKLLLAGALAIGLCPSAWGQNAVVNFKTSNTTPGSKPVTDTLGLPVNCITGCSSGGSSAITSWGGVTLGAATAWGTAPTGNVIGVNANILSPLTASGADGVSNTLSGVQTYARTQCYNGTTWDRCTQIGTGTPGTANTTTVLSTQFVTGGVPYVVVGPTADGTAAATNPILMAGTVDGTNTGAVAIPKITAGGIVSTDQSTLNSVALGSPSNFGTTPGAVEVAGVNASLFMGTAIISTTNGIYSNLLQGNAVLSATNGIYGNILQGNAVLSATNGLYVNQLQGNAVLSATNPSFASITDGTNKAAVKAASTAPVATDPALVVSISPNSINANGPATPANSAPVVVNNTTGIPIAGTGPAAVSAAVPTTQSSQYPTNATTTTPTAVTATATGTTAATAASLGATASVTNFVCGFDITADAAALATGTATLSGTISGSLNYLQTITAITNGTSQLTRAFNPCIPASAANTAITITSAAAGTSGNTIVNIWGYRL